MREPTTNFFSRELSWIAFNKRVLEEAQTADKPLVERARFLAITSSNLDEFTMVRMARLHSSRHDRKPDPGGLTAAEQLAEAQELLQELVGDQYACWRDEVEPAMAAAGFRIVRAAQWDDEDRASMLAYYHQHLAPVVTPLAVDSGRPMPMLAGLTIHLALLLEPPATDSRKGPLRALVTLPSGPRLIALGGDDDGRYALAEDILASFADDTLFPGFTITASTAFRVTRDAELDFDEEDAQDLLEEIEEELRHRGHGRPVRLELEADCDHTLHDWLVDVLETEAGDTFAINGPLDLTFLMGIDKQIPDPALCYQSFAPVVKHDWSDPFELLRKREVLLHHPFDCFQPVVDLIERAAADDNVLAIKQTLYRVSGNSPIVRSLIRAARAGKQVTVMVELKARFDEQANIRWARRLEQAGAHVVYGLVGYKVHAKLLLIIRRDEDGIRRYCHLGTGNYNDKTARLYTDISYLTTNEAVGRDMADLFNVLTGFAEPPDWERLSVAPMTMRKRFIELIRAEALIARAGGRGRIICKFNSLNDPEICDALYAASRDGVEIDLIVRGICILRPGVAGVSENIRVRSVVGRFLEHSRIFYFGGGGAPYVGIASADWMGRNLDRRVEHMVQIVESPLVDELFALLNRYLEDNRAVRLLQADGSYVRLTDGDGTRTAQDSLLAEAAAAGSRRSEPDRKRALKPLKAPRKG